MKDEEDRLIVSTPPKVAGGIPSVVHALDHAFDEMGVGRSAETLLKVNQFKGLDCPACAWPDPDRRSPIAEFCENGAKAVAEEATNKRVAPEFFQKYSISELSEHSDYWL